MKPERLMEFSWKHGLDPKQMERVKNTLKMLDTEQFCFREEACKLKQTKIAEQGRGGQIR